MKVLLYALLCILLFSCGSTPDTGLSDSVSSRDSALAAVDRKDVHQSCCFQSEQDFASFFPDTCGNFIRQPLPSIALKCVTDTLTHSSARYGYSNEALHLVTVTLADYCTSPSMLQTDYALQFERCKNDASKSEFNEFDVPSSHHGFTHFNNKTRTAVLVIAVDNRFLVEITDQVCENTKNVLAIYEGLPLNSLSTYRR